MFDEGNSIECALQFYPYPIKSDSGEDELKFVASGTKDELEDAYYSLFKNFTRTPFDNAHLKVKATDPEWQRMHLTENFSILISDGFCFHLLQFCHNLT